MEEERRGGNKEEVKEQEDEGLAPGPVAKTPHSQG